MIQDLFSNGIVRLYHISTTPFEIFSFMGLTYYQIAFQKRLHVCSQLETLPICPSYKQNALEDVFWQSLKNIFHIYEFNSTLTATYFQIATQQKQKQK